MFIVDPDAGDEDVVKLSEGVQKIITGQGGSSTKTEMMGKRQLAYEINHKKDGTYVLLEVEGSGAEIAEVERRMRVNDQILRYMTVRVDEMRRRAEKLKARRARKAEKQPSNGKAKAVETDTDTDDDESAGILWGDAFAAGGDVVDSVSLRQRWMGLPDHVPDPWNGFFAALRYDNRSNRLVAGADLFGLFPVYYWTSADVVLIGEVRDAETARIAAGSP